MLNLHFCGYIALAICFEQFPLRRVVPWEITPSLAVCVSGIAGNTEIADQRFANGKFLLLNRKAKSFSSNIQASRKTTVKTVEHRVTPLLHWQCNAVKLREAVPLKGGIISVFDIVRAVDCVAEPLRDNLALRQINNLRLVPVHAVRHQQNLEIGALDILIRARFGDGDAAECLQIN